MVAPKAEAMEKRAMDMIVFIGYSLHSIMV